MTCLILMRQLNICIKVEHILMKNIVDEVVVNRITQDKAAAILKRKKKRSLLKM